MLAIGAQGLFSSSVATTPKNTAMLLKTGQTVSYFDYDDGYYEDGRQSSILLLDQPNIYNTYNRYEQHSLNPNIIVDFNSVDPVNGNMIWYDKNDVTTARTIVNHCLYSSTKVVSGFANWRVTNRVQLENIRSDAQNFGWNTPAFGFNGSGIGDYFLTNTVVHLSGGTQIWMHYNHNSVYSQARGIAESLPAMFCRIGNISEL